MGNGSLVNQLIGDGERFLAALRQHDTVKTAIWLKEIESGDWNLYVVLNSIRLGRARDGYRMVLTAASQMQSPKINTSNVTVVPIDDVRVAGLTNLAASYIRTTPPPKMHFGLGGVEFDDAYVYELPVGSSHA